MSRPKGLPKTGGRKAGTPNKRTVVLKEELERVGFDWQVEFQKAYSASETFKCKILVDLLPYLTVKLKEQESKEDDENVPVTDASTEDLLNVIK